MPLVPLFADQMFLLALTLVAASTMYTLFFAHLAGLCTIGELEGNVGATLDCASSNALHWSLGECENDGSLTFACASTHNVKPVCQPKALAMAKVR